MLAEPAAFDADAAASVALMVAVEAKVPAALADETDTVLLETASDAAPCAEMAAVTESSAAIDASVAA